MLLGGFPNGWQVKPQDKVPNDVRYTFYGIVDQYLMGDLYA